MRSHLPLSTVKRVEGSRWTRLKLGALRGKGGTLHCMWLKMDGNPYRPGLVAQKVAFHHND